MKNQTFEEFLREKCPDQCTKCHHEFWYTRGDFEEIKMHEKIYESLKLL